MASTKVKELPLTEPELLEALTNFFQLVVTTKGPFKIGRCDEAATDSLKDREMYEGDPRFTSIWHGSPGKCARLEKILIDYALRLLPDRCVNRQRGGGGSADTEVHHVYFVRWPESNVNTIRQAVRRAVRELAGLAAKT